MANRTYDYDEMLKKYGVESTAEKPQNISDEEWERYRMAYLQKSAAEGVDAELSKAKEQAAVSQELARGYLAQYLQGTGLANLGVSQKAILDSEANYNNNVANLGYAAAAEKRQIDSNYNLGLSELSAKWADKYLDNYNSIVKSVNSAGSSYSADDIKNYVEQQKAKAPGYESELDDLVARAYKREYLNNYNSIVEKLNSSDIAYTADDIKNYIEKNKGKAQGYESELDDLVAQAYKQEEENYKKQLAEAGSLEALGAIRENYSETTVNNLENEYKQKEAEFYPKGKGTVIGQGQQHGQTFSYNGVVYNIAWSDYIKAKDCASANLPNVKDYPAHSVIEIEKNGEKQYYYRYANQWQRIIPRKA